MSSMSAAAADAATVGDAPAHRGWGRVRYLVPTSLTMGSVLCGWYAIVCSFRGALAFADSRLAAGLFVHATMAIGLAIVLDNLDGRIARIIGASSEFGGELDSLADVLAFGVAAAVLAYVSSYGAIDRLQTAAFILSFVFIAAGTLRLARSNVLAHDERHFTGLPIPAAAGGVAAAVHFYYAPLTGAAQRGDIDFRSFTLVMMGLVVLLSLLMVSTFPYSKLKLARTQIGIAFPAIAIAVAVGILYASRWPVLIIAFLYVTHGPVLWAVRSARRTT
ncbi:MAG: CDP-alcohol phosphatidyltransferase family protein [Acidobacteriota bacterium]|nr:CDP-alcohol phosphatidyltransferase family protein [Acidobacteriota bacterium]